MLLRGILAVGLKFGLDGAMYVTDWITGWDSKNRGRIWKLDTPATAGSAERKEVQTLLGENFDSESSPGVCDAARARRHARSSEGAVRAGSPERQRDPHGGGQGPRPSARARFMRSGAWRSWRARNPSLAASLQPYLTDADAEIRAQAAKMLGDMRYAPAAPALMTMVGDAAARPRFFATEALGRLAHKPATPRIIAMLADNDDKDVYLRHAGGLALARIGDVQAIAALSTHQSKGVRIAAINALRRLRSAELAKFLADSDELIVQETARAINDDGGVEAGCRRSARSWRRAISERAAAAARDQRQPSGRYGGRGGASGNVRWRWHGRPAAMRVEAVAALGVFPSPSPMDRVDGYYIGQPAPRDSASGASGGARASERPQRVAARRALQCPQPT